MAIDINDGIDISWKVHESNAQIIGHGHVSGENGQIDSDLATLTKAIRFGNQLARTVHET